MSSLDAAQARADLQLELGEVARHITTAVAELASPLRDLVELQLDFLDRLSRAAVTLAAAYQTPDSAEKRSRRVALAAAQEMLYLALRVHHQLMSAPAGAARSGAIGDRAAYSGASFDDGSLPLIDDGSLPLNDDGSLPLNDDGNKSLLGSTILAGDYCFSRAAQFAAQTDNPKVVAIFAHSLQHISEGRLRQLFGRNDEGFDESAELMRSGAVAASELASHAPDVRRAINGLISFITHPGENDKPTTSTQRLLAETFTAEQRMRWELVLALVLASVSPAK